MNEWATLVVSAVLAAVLALLVPRVWVLVRKRRRGPLSSSVSFSHLHPFAPTFLVPDGVARPEDAQGEPDSRERDAWLRQVGVPLGYQSVRLVLRGQSPSPVVITGVDLVVLSSGPPLEGWFTAPELGAALDVRTFVADLDARRPRALLLESAPDGGRLRRSYSFRVSDTEVEHFEVDVFTTSGSYTWGLDISYEDEGRSGVLRIRDDRLRVTALVEDRQRSVWQEADGSWTDAAWGYGFADPAISAWRNVTRVP